METDASNLSLDIDFRMNIDFSKIRFPISCSVTVIWTIGSDCASSTFCSSSSAIEIQPQLSRLFSQSKYWQQLPERLMPALVYCQSQTFRCRFLIHKLSIVIVLTLSLVVLFLRISITAFRLEIALSIFYFSHTTSLYQTKISHLAALDNPHQRSHDLISILNLLHILNRTIS